jgi:hypothetical protein
MYAEQVSVNRFYPENQLCSPRPDRSQSSAAPPPPPGPRITVDAAYGTEA